MLRFSAAMPDRERQEFLRDLTRQTEERWKTGVINMGRTSWQVSCSMISPACLCSPLWSAR